MCRVNALEFICAAGVLCRGSFNEKIKRKCARGAVFLVNDTLTCISMFFVLVLCVCSAVVLISAFRLFAAVVSRLFLVPYCRPPPPPPHPACALLGLSVAC